MRALDLDKDWSGHRAAAPWRAKQRRETFLTSQARHIMGFEGSISGVTQAKLHVRCGPAPENRRLSSSQAGVFFISGRSFLLLPNYIVFCVDFFRKS